MDGIPQANWVQGEMLEVWCMEGFHKTEFDLTIGKGFLGSVCHDTRECSIR